MCVQQKTNKQVCRYPNIEFQQLWIKEDLLLDPELLTVSTLLAKDPDHYTVTLAMTPLLQKSHSVLRPCTKVPLYNTCVTKINKHPPSLLLTSSRPPWPCLLLKGGLRSALFSCLMCPPVLSLTPSAAPSQHRKPPRLAANRKPCCPSVLGRAKPYQLWKQCLLLGFLF